MSQKSSNTLRSEASGAPKLPPLNLRPYFNPASTLPPSSPPEQSPPSTSYYTPLSVTTPRGQNFGFLEHPHKYSAIYEDASSERTGSFVTARSETGPGILTKHDMPSTADVVWHTSAPTDAEEQDLGDVGAERRSMDERSVSSESGYSIGSMTVLDVAEDKVEDVWEEMPKEEDGDSFVMRRWDKGLFTPGKDPEEVVQSTGRCSANHERQARVLFWLGFVAPWCWLIGGWMLPRKGRRKPSEPEAQITAKSTETEAACEGKARYMDGFKKMVLPHPSHRASTIALSTFSGVTLAPKPQRQQQEAQLDLWVSRCRIAAIAAGVILSVGLLVTLIVLTR